jgi:hypothetical protein
LADEGYAIFNFPPISSLNPMSLLDSLAETRIRDAIAAGDLRDLPGSGQPLPPDEARNVPEPLRMAYRMLRHTGFVPPEIELYREINALTARLAAGEDPQNCPALTRRLRYLELKLASHSSDCRTSLTDPAYASQLASRLSDRVDA